MYSLKIDNSVVSFLNESKEHLLQHEVLNSQLVSFAERFKSQGKEPYRLLRLLDDHHKVVVAAIQTDPERNLVISFSNAKLMKIFAEEIIKKEINLNGVIGPNQSVDTFALEWKKQIGIDFRVNVNLRLFELTHLTPPPTVSGNARVATSNDLDLIVDWQMAFGAEALPNDPRSPRDNYIERLHPLIKDGAFFLWEDKSQIVCMVGSTRESAAGRWIAPVYTPKHLRGRGYGTALTAFVSEWILKSGKKGLLYTDQSNPTSNSIYQKIGYRPLGDFKTIVFVK